jgi:hypothetical protein
MLAPNCRAAKERAIVASAGRRGGLAAPAAFVRDAIDHPVRVVVDEQCPVAGHGDAGDARELIRVGTKIMG